MKKIMLLAAIVVACKVENRKEIVAFPTEPALDDEWAVYEGRWLAKEAIVRFELYLKSGTVGIDSYYRLHEKLDSDSLSSGTTSRGLYYSYAGSPDMELRIKLPGLGPYSKGTYLRYHGEDSDFPDEMYFITRGNGELIPCDNQFEPITTDWQYTLHRRSRTFTIEGYVTFEKDSTRFFERNTRERWIVTSLGEYDKLKLKYSQLAKDPNEGIYLRALAYTLVGDSLPEKSSLTIKRIVAFGDEFHRDQLVK